MVSSRILLRSLFLGFFMAIGIAGAAACTRRAGPPAMEPTPTRALATPMSQSPAAGICAETEGEIVTVTIYPDIPDPRCSVVKPYQRLHIVNARAERITVRLADLDVDIDPTKEFTFGVTFGQLLLPGVHVVDVSPCCGAELVLGPIR